MFICFLNKTSRYWQDLKADSFFSYLGVSFINLIYTSFRQFIAYAGKIIFVLLHVELL